MADAFVCSRCRRYHHFNHSRFHRSRNIRARYSRATIARFSVASVAAWMASISSAMTLSSAGRYFGSSARHLRVAPDGDHQELGLARAAAEMEYSNPPTLLCRRGRRPGNGIKAWSFPWSTSGDDRDRPIHVGFALEVTRSPSLRFDFVVIVVHALDALPNGACFENINFSGKAITVRSSDSNDLSVVAATVMNGSLPSDPNKASVVRFETGEGLQSVFRRPNAHGRDWPCFHAGRTKVWWWHLLFDFKSDRQEECNSPKPSDEWRRHLLHQRSISSC